MITPPVRALSVFWRQAGRLSLALSFAPSRSFVLARPHAPDDPSAGSRPDSAEHEHRTRGLPHQGHASILPLKTKVHQQFARLATLKRLPMADPARRAPCRGRLRSSLQCLICPASPWRSARQTLWSLPHGAQRSSAVRLTARPDGAVEERGRAADDAARRAHREGNVLRARRVDDPAGLVGDVLPKPPARRPPEAERRISCK